MKANAVRNVFFDLSRYRAITVFKLGIWISVVLLGVTWGAVMLGQSQPVPPSIAQLRLTDCAPPCWVGIIPGETTIAEAKAKIVAAFIDGSGRTIRDPGFGDAYNSSTTVENRIVDDDFLLIVRFNITGLVDGKSEIVQSIDLFQSSGEISAPTVGEMLGTFGAPEGVVVEAFTRIGYEISLKYSGWDATFYTAQNRVGLDENTHIFLETPESRVLPRSWVGMRTLRLSD